MRNIRALHSKDDYDWALREIERYFDKQPVPGATEADRFDVLAAVIKEYEDREEAAMPDADPIDVLKFAIDSMGRTQAELGHLIGRSRATEVLKRKRRLTLDMIRVISQAWKLPIETLTKEYDLETEYS
jgi:HTH-type transcriptional regulator / antitoxin HigA